MPIVPPALDDRGFDDLVADLVRRIPAHTPEWTDPRMGDPGRTLIDLFAWMGDTILYRANLIPERQRLAFLRLLGQGMRPAQPASGLVQVSIDDPTATSAFTVPPRHPVTAPVPFETTEEMTVLPVEGHIFIKRKPSSSEAAQFEQLIPDLQELYGLSRRPSAYVTTPVFTGSMADAEGFDPAASSIDQSIWIALCASTPDAETKARIRKELGGGEAKQRRAISIGVSPYIDIPAGMEPVGIRSPIAHRWDICSNSNGPATYAPLDLLADRTSGLTRPGTIRLLLPGGDDFGAPSNDVRNRLDAGVGTAPPRIDDPVLAARLITWIRLRPTANLQPGTLRLSWLGINAVRIEARKTVGRQHIATGTGLSDQNIALGLQQVDTDSLQIEVEEEEGLIAWRQVPDIASAASNARAYSLDAEAGTLAFGDGVHGAVPAIGRAIHVATARSGGGIAGNVPAETIKAMTSPHGAAKVKVHQPLAMTGGRDSELLADAERRIPSAIRHGNRAVTRDDWRDMALQTPGVSIGRVEVLERFKPHQRQFNLPGVMSVMVIPDRSGHTAPTPRADRPMLETVYNWLDQRRPLGTELYIISPEYRPIGVSAAVELVDPAQRDDVLVAVQAVIRQHLWPLAPGGADGTGWTLGASVDDRLIETAIARVPGVRSVAPVRLFRRSGSSQNWILVNADSSGREFITLARWQLPELAMLSVGIGTSAATSLSGGLGGADGSGGDGDGDLSIPIVPELC